jgi:hypothetical protein
MRPAISRRLIDIVALSSMGGLANRCGINHRRHVWSRLRASLSHIALDTVPSFAAPDSMGRGGEHTVA